jgi:hypothetical protein
MIWQDGHHQIDHQMQGQIDSVLSSNKLFKKYLTPHPDYPNMLTIIRAASDRCAEF